MFNTPTPQENCAVFELMWKNMLDPTQDTDGNIIRCVRFACWIAKAAVTLLVCKTWFPTATMGTRTRLSVTLYVHCLSCSTLYQMNSGFCCESNESNTRLRDRQPRILGSTPSKGTVFSLFQSVQTVCGAHSASCSVGRDYFTPGQRGGGETPGE